MRMPVGLGVEQGAVSVRSSFMAFELSALGFDRPTLLFFTTDVFFGGLVEFASVVARQSVFVTMEYGLFE